MNKIKSSCERDPSANYEIDVNPSASIDPNSFNYLLQLRIQIDGKIIQLTETAFWVLFFLLRVSPWKNVDCT